MNGAQFKGITSEQRKRWVAAVAGSGDPRIAALAPLVTMLGKGAALCIVMPGMPFPSRRALRGRGAIVIVCDDAGAAAGPEGFHLQSLRKLACRAKAWAVLAGRPPAEFYEESAEIAVAGGLVILIDTQPTHDCAWLAYLRANTPRSSGKLMGTPNFSAYCEAMHEGAGAARH